MAIMFPGVILILIYMSQSVVLMPSDSNIQEKPIAKTAAKTENSWFQSRVYPITLLI